MIDQTGNSLTFDGFFTASGDGATGLTVTVDIWNPAGTRVVTGGSAAEIGDGLYSYTYSGATSSAGNYRAIFKTSGTADQQHIPALWTVGKAWVQDIDAPVSTRSTYAGGAVASVTSAVTVGTNNDKAGYSLASSGLDSISTTPANFGVTPNFRQMLVATWRRFFRLHVANGTALVGYADDGATVLTSQTMAPALANQQSQGASA